MRDQLKKLNRLSAFVLLVALLCGLFASWTWAGRVRSAQEQQRDDLNLVLEASSEGWAEVTEQFFAVPESAARSVGALADQMSGDDELLILLTEMVRVSPALDAAFLGYPNGEFVFVARSDQEAPGGFRTRKISIKGREREVTLTWTDAARNELRRETDPDDRYDPRERPWYLQPDSEKLDNWTDPYVFASSQQPGITYSLRLTDDSGEQVAVVGIDMRLTELGEFLDQLAPGENGEALVLNSRGDVIAASTMNAQPIALAAIEGTLTPSNTGILAESIEQLRSGQVEVARTQSPDGLRTTVTRLAGESGEWFLAVQALDSDVMGDFRDDSAQNLLGIIVIGMATALIAGSLGFRFLSWRNRLTTEAERDVLTGLLSRRAITRSLEKGLRSMDLDSRLALAILDLDGFKSVNDTHGHLVGDRVLAEVAARIDSFAVNEEAIAGRLGGDEFAIIGSDGTEWDLLAKRLGEPMIVDGIEFVLGASIGVAMASDTDQQAEELMYEADHALFAVKRSGGGRALVADSTPA